MGPLAVLTGVLLGGASAAAPPRDLPGLIVYDGMGMGGLGVLDYDPGRRRYDLRDGRIVPFVVDGGRVRPMRPEEGGGTMAIPSDFGSAGGSIVALLPSYNALVKIGGDYSIAKQQGYGDFAYQGSSPSKMAIHRGTIFFFIRDLLVAYDHDLKRLGEVKVENAGGHPADFVVDGGKLYLLEGENERPAIDCAGPSSCGESFDVWAVVDVSRPRSMRVERSEKVKDPSPPVGASFKGVDAKQGAWLIVDGLGAAQTLQWRAFDRVAVVAARSASAGDIVALTPTAPFFAVRRVDGRLVLSSVTRTEKAIELGGPLELNLAGNNVVMKRHGQRLFIAAGSRLRVVNVAGAPRLELASDFDGPQGDQLQIRDFAFAFGLPPASRGADAARLKSLLALRYLAPEKMLELDAEIGKLGPEDGWAVRLLAGELSKGGQTIPLHALAARGLGNIGSGAKAAIPALLDASMQGGAILADFTQPLAEALAKIDPEGADVVAALPAFESRHYKPGARLVAKDVLRALPGAAARAALRDYR